MAGEVRIGGARVDFIARTAQFLTGSKAVSQSLRRQQQAVRALRRDVRRFNREARGLARGFGLIAIAAGGAAIRSFAQFGETMATVRGVASATSEEFAALRQQALNLGRDTRFSATQAAEGQLFLARAGLEVNEVMQALPATLRLAQATLIDVGQAGDIVTNAMAAYGAQAADTAKFVDVLTATTTAANTDIVQLADAFNLVAPIANAASVDVETLSAAVGVLSNAGIQATRAGTGLRNLILRLEAPSTKATEIFESLGISVDDLSVEARGLVPVLQTLAAANIDVGTAAELFEQRAAGIFQVLSRNIPQLKELSEALRNAAGRAEELQKIQDATLRGSFLRLISAAEGFGIAFTQTTGIGDGLRQTLDNMANAVNRVTDNIGRFADRIVHIGTFVAVFALSRTGIVKAALGIIVSLGRVALAFTSVGAAVATTVRSFSKFYAAPVRALAALRSGVETLQIRFLLLQGAARQTGTRIAAFLRAPIASIAAMRGRVNLLSVSMKATGIAARTTFAVGMTAAATAMRGFAIILRGAIGILRAFTPLILIEGLIQVAKFIGYLRDEIKKFGGSLKDVAIVGSVDFVSAFVSHLAALPFLLATVFETAFETVKSVVVRGAKAIGAAILAGIKLEDPLEAFSKEFTGAFSEAIEIAKTTFNEGIEDMNVFVDSLDFSDSLLRAFGLTDEQIANSRTALKTAFGRLVTDFKQLVNPVAGADGVNIGDIPDIPVIDIENLGDVADDVASDMEDTFDSAANAIGDGFGRIAEAAIFDFKRIGDAARNLGRQLVQSLFSKLFVNTIGTALGSYFEGLINPSSAIQKLKVTAQRRAPTFQSGGFADPGLAWVGEAGKELVHFNQPARVYSNRETERLLGGNTVVNFAPVIESDNEAAVERALVRAYPQFEESVRAGIVNDTRRHSAFSMQIRR